jgi:CubicO group peptidase (beta-lactamase class C family)
VVVDCWGGTRDREGTPWRHDTLALSFSTTKGVAATLLHVLADRGLIEYDAPVRAYWPEFAAAGKERVTVRQVLAHEAGLYHVRDLIEDAREMLDGPRMAAALAGAAPCHPPGEAHGYHAFTFGCLVGELVERVAGRPFREVLESEIAAPLELDGLFVGLPEAELARRAQLIPARRRGRLSSPGFALGRVLNRGLRLARLPFDFEHTAAALMPKGIEALDFGSEEVARATMPSVSGSFTARSLAKLYAALAAGGSLGGVRLLSPQTVARMSEVQNRGLGRVIPYPMHWRLGYHRVNALRVRVPRGFGHAGFGGSGAWADPDRELALALVLNSGAGSPFGDLRIVQISGAALRCADRR